MNSNNNSFVKQNQDNIRIFALKIAEIQARRGSFEDAKPEIKETISLLRNNFYDFYMLNLQSFCRSRSIKKCIQELDEVDNEFFNNFLNEVVNLQTSYGSFEAAKEQIKDMLFRLKLNNPYIYMTNFAILSNSPPLSLCLKELDEENNYLLEALAV